MTDLSQIGEELRRIERERSEERRKSYDRALVSLFVEEQGERIRAADSVADAIVGALCALIFLALVYPDLIAWVRELNEAYAEVGGMSGNALREVLHELDWPVWERFTELLAECMRDYPAEEALDKVFLATRAMRAFLAEAMTEEA